VRQDLLGDFHRLDGVSETRAWLLALAHRIKEFSALGLKSTIDKQLLAPCDIAGVIAHADRITICVQPTIALVFCLNTDARGNASPLKRYVGRWTSC